MTSSHNAEPLPRAQTIFLESAARRTLLHCSDIHVGRRFQPLPAQRLIESARSLKPDAVVVSGDLTMRARRGQYRKARAIVEQLPHPLSVIPGNHDIPLYNLPLRLLAPFANWRRWIADLDDGVLDLGVCSVWSVNTINRFVHQKGRLRESDLVAIEAWSRTQPPDVWRVVVVHQHFANTPDNPRPGIYARPCALLKRLARAGIHLVLHGHVHQSGVFAASEFFADFAEPLVVAAAGTASSGRTRGGDRIFQFNLITFERDRFEITIWNWNSQQMTFEPGPSRSFDRSFFVKK